MHGLSLQVYCRYQSGILCLYANLSFSPAVLPDSYTSKYTSKYSGAKWDEPDTVYGALSDKKPYSKVEQGSSFFSTYGYTNRKKDYVAEKVRDYYYFGDQPKVRPCQPRT